VLIVGVRVLGVALADAANEAARRKRTRHKLGALEPWLSTSCWCRTHRRNVSECHRMRVGGEGVRKFLGSENSTSCGLHLPSET
jgi:hypothetical protein